MDFEPTKAYHYRTQLSSAIVNKKSKKFRPFFEQKYAWLSTDTCALGDDVVF